MNQDTWVQVSEVSSTEEMVDSMQQEDYQQEVVSGDMKMMEDMRADMAVSGEQYRRHNDMIENHEKRICHLEGVPA